MSDPAEEFKGLCRLQNELALEHARAQGRGAHAGDARALGSRDGGACGEAGGAG